MKTIEEILQEVDRLFDENQAKEAEKLLLSSLEEARDAGNQGMCLQLMNELIGYYRQTSEKDRLYEVIGESLALAEVMGFRGTLQYATTALNAANAYRSIGELQKSQSCYEETEEIYLRELADNDMLLAGLYNNRSLLFQEQGHYELAEEYLLKALDIVLANEAGFEIAVTYANLANTAVMAGKYDVALAYSEKAIECFKARNLYDAHYCAALSAMGMCFFKAGKREEAIRLFEDGMDIVESTLGKNTQYYRLKANRDACLREPAESSAGKKDASGQSSESGADRKNNTAGNGNKSADMKEYGSDDDVQKGSGYDGFGGTEASDGMPEKEKFLSGMELSRAYYEKYGKPMLEEKFSSYLGRIATGLVGEGSDCMGFDDETSRDHDSGPDFCIFISKALDAEIGDALRAAYDELPTEFMGLKRQRTSRADGRRGVVIIEDFYRKYAGMREDGSFDFRNVEEPSLYAATDGEVFDDPEGIFTAIREKLLNGYPEEILYLKLAEDCARLSQTGQYNYKRMLERGDRLTADRMLADFIAQAMRFWHHIQGKFAPHDKWLKASCLRLDGGDRIVTILEQLHASYKMEDEDAERTVEALTEILCSDFAKLLYDESYISDTDPYLDHQVEELLIKADYASRTDEELVNLVARTEFKAFDEVKNEGGRAYCQNDWPTFSVMRKSQYLTWDRTMLMQYLYDFNREFAIGHNLITEKYGRMMESTAPDKYAELEHHFPEISEEKKAVIEQIVALQMNMVEDFAKEHPKVVSNARNLHTYEDNVIDTSYETYLRGEISTYSDKMLQLYAGYVIRCVREGVNIARRTIENTARLYGYKNLDDFEASI